MSASKLDRPARRHCLSVAVLALAMALAACLPLAPTAAATGTQRLPRVIYDCVHRRFEPSNIIATCGDGGVRAHHLHYRSYSGVRARGSGRMALLVCKPDCANGHVIQRRFVFTFHRPRGTGRARVFTRMTVTYRRNTPGGRHQTYNIA